MSVPGFKVFHELHDGQHRVTIYNEMKRDYIAFTFGEDWTALALTRGEGDPPK